MTELTYELIGHGPSLVKRCKGGIVSCGSIIFQESQWMFDLTFLCNTDDRNFVRIDDVMHVSEGKEFIPCWKADIETRTSTSLVIYLVDRCREIAQDRKSHFFSIPENCLRGFYGSERYRSNRDSCVALYVDLSLFRYVHS